MSAEEDVFTNDDLRLYILKFIVEPNCCIKCGEKKANYYIYHYDYPYFCLWCSPRDERWWREVLLYNRAICSNN